jgi:hypothetical protein
VTPPRLQHLPLASTVAVSAASSHTSYYARCGSSFTTSMAASSAASFHASNIGGPKSSGDAGQKNVPVACPKGRFAPDVPQILSGVPSPSPVYRGSIGDAGHDFYTCFLFGGRVWGTWLGKRPPPNENFLWTSPKRQFGAIAGRRLGDATGDALTMTTKVESETTSRQEGSVALRSDLNPLNDLMKPHWNTCTNLAGVATASWWHA